MTRAFFFGRLRDPALRDTVLGEAVATGDAVLEGRAARIAEGSEAPVLMAAAAARTPGVLTAPLSPAVEARLTWYLAACGATPTEATVDGRDVRIFEAGGVAQARTWSLAAWQERWGAIARTAAAEVMGHYPERPPAWIASRWAQILQRAASAVRAAETPSPATTRSALAAGDVEVVARRRPYTDYFSVVTQSLRFRRFDGAMSDLVERAALVAGDAVTVLPYDVRADTVLVVEQFRFGPWARGDLRPWTLEPIAGRIDVGEAPEETARREAREEAGVEIGTLYRVAGYYPTTGAMSEHVVSFVGTCDLAGQAGTVSGAAVEDEDILSHVVPFARLMDLVATGEAENAPLLLSAYWLAMNRERLRGA